MNVLVSFFNQSGNTEKIAKAIYEETSLTNEADLKKLEDVGAEDFAGYDFIFIGSPLHSANLAAPVKEFLTNIQAGSGQKMAGFITHFSPAYPDQDMDGFTEPIKEACKEKGIGYKAVLTARVLWPKPCTSQYRKSLVYLTSSGRGWSNK